MDKKREQDFADLEVKRLCGVFGTPIPALPPEQEKPLDNPYCFRYGDMAIKLEFAEDGPSLQELLTGFFLRQKSGL